ncbi:MAG: hypothetical protein K9K66_17210 [Desulfarculaceae bacterium]|nr:hypothetical protein [Desulfarculaceae bacterium]MCF8071472.1 hypothetical protein [Desulfarculaceae bacterium]MCF8103400.1 hypothetical protein [Desulfarculaceae bacterium]MCF8118060.1 hypothetical protein [Desulfarculaceae bacterium]
MSRPHVSGWRQRRGLGLVMINGWTWGGAAALVQALTDSRLNLPFVLLQDAAGAVRGGLALDQGASLLAADTAEYLARQNRLPVPELCPAAGALLVHPLRGGLFLAASALSALSKGGVAPLATGTSPAALSLVFTGADLPRAIELLSAAWDLSDEPLVEQVAVVQSASRRES